MALSESLVSSLLLKKKMVNDGEILVSDGSFTATLDANSVTTFTTDPGNGGKAGNINPTAFAGEDILINDTIGTGMVEIKLDGTLSSDPDGKITNYSWSLNGQQIAWEPIHDITLSTGEYEYVLTVTDNDGATAIDTLHIELKSILSTEIWLEAECGKIGANWQNLADANASNGAYVESVDGVQSLVGGLNIPDYLITYSFTTSEAGNYKVWGRVITPTADDDSFWIKVDNSAWIMWNSIPAGTSWHWDDVHRSSNDITIYYRLEPGTHTLSICMREDGTKLDKILIANTGIVPSGAGGEATNCVAVNNTRLLEEPKGIFEVYPNPSTGKVTIFRDKKFKSLKVLNLHGQSQFYKEYNSETESVEEEFDFEPGIYMLVLRNDESSAFKKIILK